MHVEWACVYIIRKLKIPLSYFFLLPFTHKIREEILGTLIHWQWKQNQVLLNLLKKRDRGGNDPLLANVMLQVPLEQTIVSKMSLSFLSFGVKRADNLYHKIIDLYAIHRGMLIWLVSPLRLIFPPKPFWVWEIQCHLKVVVTETLFTF